MTSFTATRTGFTAQADLEAENLVLFSVPYDDGFTATVNGVPAEVEKVDNGLMAVAARRATARSCSPTTRPVCGRALPSAPALLWCMPCG